MDTDIGRNSSFFNTSISSGKNITYKKNIEQMQTELTNLKNTINLLADKQIVLLKQIDDANRDLLNMQTMFFSRSKALMQIFLTPY